MGGLRTSVVSVEDLSLSTYRVPTPQPESDATYEWDSTTVVVVEAHGGGQTGLGYAYASSATARVIAESLAPVVCGRDAMDVGGCWAVMLRAVREATRPGVASSAVSAVDAALWDLKARLLDLPLASLLGSVHARVPMYGSGGFTSASVHELQRELAGWVEMGVRRVKMKVGQHPDADVARVRAARQVIGPETELFVDANGGYSRKQALAYADRFAEHGVRWFEEPVSSDDLDGLRLLRDRVPGGMDVAAGEYGYDLVYFRRMLDAGAVDVLQGDARRCGGVTGFLKLAALCEAYAIPLSSHTAPSLHLPICGAMGPVRHVEYFIDHVRVERLLFDGCIAPQDGMLAPDRERLGFGLELKRAEAERYAI